MQKKPADFGRHARQLYASRGQVSAPFELFVAIIIMTFVVLIGSQMIFNANTNVCLNSIDKAMTEFKGKLEETANQKSSTQFMFQPDKCFDAKKAKISIEKFNTTRQCSAKCGKPWDSCFVLSFSSSELAAYREKCLNLPQYTTFYSALDSAMCPDIEHYTAISPANGGIKLGSYILKNVSSIGETWPKVCVYYSVKG